MRLKFSLCFKFLAISIFSLIIISLQCSCTFSKYKYGWQLEYLGVPEIWDKATGKDVVVAIIDSGIDYNLLGDSFNLTRIIASYNSYDCNDEVFDYTKHGTAMAILIGANGENGFYGVAPECKFIIVKAMNAIGLTTADALARGIDFAMDFGANIINLSLGSTVFNQSVADSIDEAVKKNIIVTSAVGDQKKDKILFPSSYDATLSVAAIDINEKLYDNSNYADDIDICAPGVDILVPSMNAANEIIVTKKSGSSIATAIFSGYIAVYFDYIKEYDVKEILEQFRLNQYNFKKLL